MAKNPTENEVNEPLAALVELPLIEALILAKFKPPLMPKVVLDCAETVVTDPIARMAKSNFFMNCDVSWCDVAGVDRIEFKRFNWPCKFYCPFAKSANGFSGISFMHLKWPSGHFSCPNLEQGRQASSIPATSA